MPSLPRILLLSLPLSSLPLVDAMALSPACEAFVAASEKSASQPARHAITEMHEGVIGEAISIDGKSYLKADRGWRALTIDLLAKEREMNAQMRRGELALESCENLGAQSVDGVTTTAIRYRLAIPGAYAASSTAHIRADGLVEAVSSEDGTLVHFRYEDIRAPLP